MDSISVIGDRYYGATLVGSGLDRLYQTHTIYVRRKQYMLPYEQDIHGLALHTHALLQQYVIHPQLQTSLMWKGHNCGMAVGRISGDV